MPLAIQVLTEITLILAMACTMTLGGFPFGSSPSPTAWSYVAMGLGLSLCLALLARGYTVLAADVRRERDRWSRANVVMRVAVPAVMLLGARAIRNGGWF